MRPSKQIKPVSFVAENQGRIVEALDESGDSVILTEDGEARAVIMSVREYERLHDTLALLNRLADAERNIAQGRTRPAREALEEIRAKYAGN